MALISSKLLQTLALLCSLFLVIMMNKLVHSESEDSTAFIFGSFDEKPSDATYQGDASGRGDLLSLTKIDAKMLPAQHSVGRILYSKPVQFWKPERQAIFQTTITFKINTCDGDPGDGITFFIAPVGTVIPSGSTGGNLGVFGSNGKSPNLFAVEFDSNINYWDPSYRHIGIDIRERKSRATTRLEDFLDKDVTATISYRDGTVTVVAFTDTRTFRVSHDVDLKSYLPQEVQVGISGSTGDKVEYNYIRSWSFTSTLVYDSTAKIQYNNSQNLQDTYIRKYGVV